MVVVAVEVVFPGYITVRFLSRTDFSGAILLCFLIALIGCLLIIECMILSYPQYDFRIVLS